MGCSLAGQVSARAGCAPARHQQLLHPRTGPVPWARRPTSAPHTSRLLPCTHRVLQALAEKEGEGMAKMIYNKASGEILGVHIIGLHAADLIHEASNAIATGQTVSDIKFNVHAHPTLSEVRGSAAQGVPRRAGRQAAGAPVPVPTAGPAPPAPNTPPPPAPQVLDELFKQAHVEKPAKAAAPAKQPVAA